ILDFLLRDCERLYPFKYLSIVRRSTSKSRANWLLLIFILELSISKFNLGKSSSPLISIFVLISICICIIFTSKILCMTNHLLYILIQSFLYIVRVSFIYNDAKRCKSNTPVSIWTYFYPLVKNRNIDLMGFRWIDWLCPYNCVKGSFNRNKKRVSLTPKQSMFSTTKTRRN